MIWNIHLLKLSMISYIFISSVVLEVVEVVVQDKEDEAFPPTSSAFALSLFISSWRCCPILDTNCALLHLYWGLGSALWYTWHPASLCHIIWILLSKFKYDLISPRNNRGHDRRGYVCYHWGGRTRSSMFVESFCFTKMHCLTPVPLHSLSPLSQRWLRGLWHLVCLTTW